MRCVVTRNMLRRYTAQPFDSWCAAAQRLTYERRTCEACLARMRQRGLAAAFRGWQVMETTCSPQTRVLVDEVLTLTAFRRRRLHESIFDVLCSYWLLDRKARWLDKCCRNMCGFNMCVRCASTTSAAGGSSKEGAQPDSGGGRRDAATLRDAQRCVLGLA